jgi:hypothetical protein
MLPWHSLLLQSARQAIYIIMDSFVGFDHCVLTEESCDLTTFQTPLGLFCLTHYLWDGQILPQFFRTIWHLSFSMKSTLHQIFKRTLDLIHAINFSRHLWNHSRKLQHLMIHLKAYFMCPSSSSSSQHARATVSVKKLFLCTWGRLVVSQWCTYEGHVPNKSKIDKIRNWPPCTLCLEVWGFLGTAGTVCNWIKDYALIA